MIKYSFIIPTLNEEKLLPNLLSIIAKKELMGNYNYEIIVSDGGSTDDTIAVAKKFGVNIIENVSGDKQNIAMGRNLGAKRATGEIFIFLNGDVLLNEFELLLNTIEVEFINSNYKAMTCCVKVFKDEQKFIDIVFQTFYNYYFHLLNIIGLGMGRGECHIIPKDVFFDFNGYDERLAAGEDFDLFRRIRKKGKILFSRKIVVYESPRRYRKLGHFRILSTWLINSIYIIFTKTSKSSEWKPVR